MALWLISYNISVILNRPGVPQDNAKVERSQGTLSRWTNPKVLNTIEELQLEVRKQGEFYNLYYPTRRLKNKTKAELFPSLFMPKNNWNPTDFDIQRALNFLAKSTWERRVSSNGQLSIYGQRFSISTKYKYQIVTIILNSETNQWDVFHDTGALLKSVDTKFSHDTIWNLDYH